MLSIWIIILVTLGYFLYRLLICNSSSATLPPGPKPWPVIGNFFDLPAQGIPEYQHWLKHKDQYGPISSVQVLGQVMVLLHSREAVNELLERNSIKTSSRPRFDFGSSMCGFGKFISFMHYGEAFKRHRKFIHQQFGTKQLASRYNSVQETEATHLLLRALEQPTELIQHFKTEAAAVILKITYGYSIDQKQADPMISLIGKMMENASLAFVPMSWPPDLIPALRYLPPWFPGTSFQITAKEWNKINQAVSDIPYAFVKHQMANKINKPCYVRRQLEHSTQNGQDLNHEAEDTIKNTAGILFAGGSDTTVSSLSSFILAMIKFPDVQCKAQGEIDALTKSTRLPHIADRENLPYVEGIVKEVLRWFPITPMGVSHAVDDDVVLQGYTIPKGAIILPATRWLLHDPDTYKDPESFNPDRYFSPQSEPDPKEFAFGFGRRVCPGRHLAESALFVTIAQFLATFHVDKALDKKGRAIEPENRSIPGMIDHPADFPYRISPRSSKHVALIHEAQKDHPWEEADVDVLRRLYDVAFPAEDAT